MSNSGAPSSQQIQPFRFMDMPTELRLLVYGHLPRTVRHTRIVSARSAPRPYEMTLITYHVSTAILATSRQIFKEANGIVQDLITAFILPQTPTLIIGMAPSTGYFSLFTEIRQEYDRLVNSPVQNGANFFEDLGTTTSLYSPDVAADARGCGFVQQAARNMAYNQSRHSSITLLAFDNKPITAMYHALVEGTARNLLNYRTLGGKLTDPSDIGAIKEDFVAEAVLGIRDDWNDELTMKAENTLLDAVDRARPLLMACKQPGVDHGYFMLYRS